METVKKIILFLYGILFSVILLICLTSVREFDYWTRRSFRYPLVVYLVSA